MRAAEVAREVVIGILEGVIFVLLYVYLLPSLLGSLKFMLAAYYGAAPQSSYQAVTSLLAPSIEIMLVGLVEAFAVASRVLRGTVFGPVFRAFESLLGFLVVVYLASAILPGGYISASYSPAQGVKVSVSLGAYPLLAAFLVLVVLPGVVAPFIDYFMSQA